MYEAQACLCALALAPLCLNASHAKRPFPSFKTSTPLVSPSLFVDHLGGKKGNVFRGHPAHTGLLSIRLMMLEKAGVTLADTEMLQLIFATALNEHGSNRVDRARQMLRCSNTGHVNGAM